MHFRTAVFLTGAVAAVGLTGCTSSAPPGGAPNGAQTPTTTATPARGAIPADLDWPAGAQLARFDVDNLH